MQEPTAKPIHSKEGDSALMTCVVRNLGDHTVMWKTENKDRHSWKVLTAAESRITADRRFEVLHDKGEGKLSRVLKWAKVFTFLKRRKSQ